MSLKQSVHTGTKKEPFRCLAYNSGLAHSLFFSLPFFLSLSLFLSSLPYQLGVHIPAHTHTHIYWNNHMVPCWDRDAAPTNLLFSICDVSQGNTILSQRTRIHESINFILFCCTDILGWQNVDQLPVQWNNRSDLH